MDFKYKNIGFFDSGIGGISVLKNAISILPNETFIYFGDSKNSPYGSKTKDEITKLCVRICNFLIYENNCKAIVVACNTASSASINFLREIYEPKIPIIGIEPALKPSIEYIDDNKLRGKVLVLATPFTILGDKFKKMLGLYKNFNVECVALHDLAYMLEFNFDKGKVKKYLYDELKHYVGKTSCIVLGCTHYYFAIDVLEDIFGMGIRIFDGSYGTSIELKRRLEEKHIKNDLMLNGRRNIFIYNSLGEDGVVRSNELLFRRN